MELEIFKNEEFGDVRVDMINNEPWFMLSDICRVLEIKNPSQAKSRLNKCYIISNEVTLLNGYKQDGTPTYRTGLADFINESNVYKLVFQSRKPQAEKFSEWVTSEVLPSIRKHGMYAEDDLLNNPDLLIKAGQKIKEEREKNRLLLARIEADEPKVLLAEAMEVCEHDIQIGELAKIIAQNGINIGRNRMFRWMRDNKFLCTQNDMKNIPRQQYIDNGYFKINKYAYINRQGKEEIAKVVYVTPKGQQYFVKRFLKEQEQYSYGIAKACSLTESGLQC